MQRIDDFGQGCVISLPDLLNLLSSNCSGDILGAIGHRPTDFFDNERYLLTSDMSYDYSTFKARLDLSTWSTSFVHGADMMPSMVQGFDSFLKTKGTKLSKITKIRFKDITQGDLIYKIVSKPDSKLEENAKVIGQFEDDEGNLYYFYAHQEDRLLRKPDICTNMLAKILLPEYDSGTCSSGLPIMIGTDIDENIIDHPVLLMKDNIGYTWATILDILNNIIANDSNSGGLIIGYNDLHIVDGFDYADLLRKKCSITLTQIGKPRDMKAGKGYKYNFSIKHETLGEVMSGGITVMSVSQSE